VRRILRVVLAVLSCIKVADECYNFLRHVTDSPMSNHVGWPVQLLELRLAYFVLDVTLTADSSPGFNTCVLVTIVRCLWHHAILCIAYRPASAYLLIALATLTKHSPMFTCVCTDCTLLCI
jgi:hypothetical protein